MAQDSYRDRVLAGRTQWAAGAYDAFSAKMIERAGFDAVMTSGFAVSASLLGLPDAELYTMTENAGVVRNVAGAVKIPLVADMDTGYGNAINMMRSMREFERAGAAAVIIEDQVSPKRCPICVAGVEVISMEEGARKVAAAAEARQNPNTLIVARTDADTPDEALRRAKAYVAAGADIVQPISNTFRTYDQLREFRAAVGVPLSLQILGWLEQDLSREQIESVAGMATFALIPIMTVAAALQQNLAQLAKDKSVANLPLGRMNHIEFIKLIGFPEIEALQLKYLEPK
jgi:methylisocitrate lyase